METEVLSEDADVAGKSSVTSGITSSYIKPSRVWNWYREARDRSSNFRSESQKDCDYYDGDQWTDEEKQELDGRGQAPIVINRIKPTIDLVTGTQKKVRSDFKAAPRKNNGAFDAGIATECIKYVMDANQGEFVISEIEKDQVKAGWRFVEIGKNTNPFKEVIQISAVPRNDLVWDPYATEYDLSDARYEIRPKWMELEDAENLFPKYKDLLEMAVSDERLEEFKDVPYHGTEDHADRPGMKQWGKDAVSSSEWLDKSRKWVKLIECWYKVPVQAWLSENFLTGEVQEVDESKIGELLTTQGVQFNKRWIKKVRVCIVAGPYLLQDDWSDFDDNEYPFIPWWCWLSDKKREPYGMIRQRRDPQDEVNKRRSKAMHLLNSTQIIATSGVIDKKENDWPKVIEQITDPQGVVLLKDGLKDGDKFEVRNPGAQIEMQYKFEEEAKRDIEDMGVGREMQGLESNATSGRAIIARTIQSNTMLGDPFDNDRRSRQLMGQMIWSRIKQFWTKPKSIRITDKQGNFQFLGLNWPVQYQGRIYVKNSITSAMMDITIDEQAFNATIRQTLADDLSELMRKLPPEIAVLMLDDVVDLMDAPNKEKLIAKIKMVQGVMAQKSAAEQENDRMVAEATKAKAETNASVNRTGEESAMSGGL